MSREMLVNVAESDECRIAIVENGKLEELYIERPSLNNRVGNIYKGKVVNIESGIQAAFIDFGEGKNGFLHVSDLHPKYFPKTKKDKAKIQKDEAESEATENIGRRKSLRQRLPIQNTLRNGQELIVQLTKEGINAKGPTLSTYMSLPGKYLVMMPWMKKHGVSHKIEDEDERKRLRTLFAEMKPCPDTGFIIRTAGQNCSKRELQSDLRYLERLWKIIDKRITTDKSPCVLYQESDLVIRTLRDVFNSTITKIICDSPIVVRKIKDFLSIATPRLKRRAQLYESKIPLFHKYKIEEEITKIQSRTVPLKAGGSIVIEQTEALVAVDVNSGRYRQQKSAELTAYKINMEAADEIARQLRLRDLGGLIICDYIDMRMEKHRREVEKAFRTAVKTDRARSKILKISRFGVIEMTRQRMRPSLQSSTYFECPNCGGKGIVKSHESMTIEIIRTLNLAASRKHIKHIELFVSPAVADYLQNYKRAMVAQAEQASDIRITIHAESDYASEKHNLIYYNDQGSKVKL